MADGDDAEDRRAILSRRELLVAGAISGLVGAIGMDALAQPGPCLTVRGARGAFSRAPGRILTPEAQVPAAVREVVPNGTIYAAGGGARVLPWRIMAFLSGAIEVSDGVRAGALSHAPLPRRWNGELSNAALTEVLSLADRAWREQRAEVRRRRADYDEVLAMHDGSEWFFTQGFGPLRGGASEALVARLRTESNVRWPRP